MKQNPEFDEEILADLKESYEGGVTVEDAESKTFKWLLWHEMVSRQIYSADLDVRMRKNGLKAIRAALYLEMCTKGDKKPTESFLEHSLSVHELVSKAQDELDTAESKFAYLTRNYNTITQGHLSYRGISKQTYG